MHTSGESLPATSVSAILVLSANARANLILGGVAIMSLVTGILFYICFRTYSLGIGEITIRGTAFLVDASSFTDRYMGWAPTFFHVVGFAILTSLVLGHYLQLFVCIFWVAVEVVFEVAQLFVYPHYFTGGTFDPADLIAAVIGGTIALGLLNCLQYEDEPSETQRIPLQE